MRHTSHKTCYSLHALYTLLSNVHNDTHFCSFPIASVCKQSFLSAYAEFPALGQISVYVIWCQYSLGTQGLEPKFRVYIQKKTVKKGREGGRERQTGKYASYQGRFTPFLFNPWVASDIQLRFTTARRLTFMNIFVNQSSGKAFKKPLAKTRSQPSPFPRQEI